MSLEQIRYNGLDAVRLATGEVELIVATAIGPRILSYRRPGGPNLFAELGLAGLEIPGGGRFTFYGGHRLWIAPEEPERTYLADDHPVDITEIPSGLLVSARQPAVDGMTKRLEVVAGEGTTVSVAHSVSNESDAVVELAAWAITQLAPGGTGILPYGIAGAEGRQASAMLVAWPYTDLADPALDIGNDLVLVEAARTTSTKVGTDLTRGWLAYVAGSEVFVKQAAQDSSARYADRGAAAQIYCDEQFIELETLGPLVTLTPGESTTHLETWRLHQLPASIEPSQVPKEMELDG